MNTRERKNLQQKTAVSDPKKAAGELAEKLGVALASKPGAALPVGEGVDPFALMLDLKKGGFLEGGKIEGVFSPVPGRCCHYLLELEPVPKGAAKPQYGPREWMRATLPDVAACIAWLRGWVPQELLPPVFVNLWAGRGYLVDEAAGLAMGNPPRSTWLLLSEKDARGITRVARRQG